jgi:hypothetical protein
MALSTEERERIREEEWVRAQAREDFLRNAARSPLLQNNLASVAIMFAVVLGTMAVMGIFIHFMSGAGF